MIVNCKAVSPRASSDVVNPHIVEVVCKLRSAVVLLAIGPCYPGDADRG